MIGETEAATRRTLEASANKVVGGLSALASSREGAEDLQTLMDSSNYQSLAGSVPALFGGGNAASIAANAGEQLLGRLFGRDISPVAEQVARAGAVKTASAGKLLAPVASLALGLLAKRASAGALNPSEIASLPTGANAKAAGPTEDPLDDASRRGRWGPILVPKQRKEDIRPETFDDAAAELSPEPENMTEQRGPDPHLVRRIVFLLAALAALALLILLLIRGPAHPKSHNAHPGTLAMSRSPAAGLAFVEPRDCHFCAIKAATGLRILVPAFTCFIRQNLSCKYRSQSW
jgi:hypothetical protein